MFNETKNVPKQLFHTNRISQNETIITPFIFLQNKKRTNFMSISDVIVIQHLFYYNKYPTNMFPCNFLCYIKFSCNLQLFIFFFPSFYFCCCFYLFFINSSVSFLPPRILLYFVNFLFQLNSSFSYSMVVRKLNAECFYSETHLKKTIDA